MLTPASAPELQQPLLDPYHHQEGHSDRIKIYGSMNHRAIKIDPSLVCPRCRYLLDQRAKVIYVKQSDMDTEVLVHDKCVYPKEQQNKQFKVEFQTVLKTSKSDRIRLDIQGLEQGSQGLQNDRDRLDIMSKTLQVERDKLEVQKKQLERIYSIADPIKCLAWSSCIFVITYITTTSISLSR